jgi:hypothetical protein
MAHWGFPSPRARARGAPTLIGEKYERYESTAGFVAVADTDTEVITFSGRPDSIVLHALVGAVLVTLTDRLDRQTHVIPVGIGETIETHIAAERVLARENVAAAGATLSVVGKWAEPADPA